MHRIIFKLIKSIPNNKGRSISVVWSVWSVGSFSFRPSSLIGFDHAKKPARSIRFVSVALGRSSRGARVSRQAGPPFTYLFSDNGRPKNLRSSRRDKKYSISDTHTIILATAYCRLIALLRAYHVVDADASLTSLRSFPRRQRPNLALASSCDDYMAAADDDPTQQVRGST
jgi:hypothetical protein